MEISPLAGAATPLPSSQVRQIRKKHTIQIEEAVHMEEEYDHDWVVVGYEEKNLSTVRVLFVVTGTIFHGTAMFIEQLLVTLIFVMVYYLTSHHELISCMNVNGMLKLTQTATALAVFLLGFYTSNSLARWWRLRTDGVGNIWAASSELCMSISQWANPDPHVLDSIRRYARASLMLIFMRHRGQLQKLELLSERKVLTEEEVHKLEVWNNNLSETMWAWIYAIVMNLHREGKIKSEYTVWQILESVKKGRSGAALIGAQMGTPLPLQYVHILGFMVKLHNVSAAFAYGVKAGCEAESPVWQDFLLAFLPALLYNSVLMINAKLANPFAFSRLSFPEAKYDRGIGSDGLSYVQALENLPKWIKDGQKSRSMRGWSS